MGVNALTSRDQVSQRQHAAASPASVCCGISLQACDMLSLTILRD